MAEPNNDYDPVPDKAAQRKYVDLDDDHFHRPMLHLGHIPLVVLGAALLGLVFLCGGSVYLLVHWYGVVPVMLGLAGLVCVGGGAALWGWLQGRWG